MVGKYKQIGGSLENHLHSSRTLLTPLDKSVYEQFGLNSSEIAERIRLGLSNNQTFETSRTLANIVRTNLFTLFNGVVGGGFIVLLALGQWIDALFGIPVLLNIAIGVGQEVRSKRVLDRLAIISAPLVRVMRNGLLVEIRVEDIVADDLLELKSGDQVVVDARITKSLKLEVDESLLTGEAEPVVKTLGDMLYSGSGIVSGHASAQVQKVGAETYASKITLEARRFSLVNSEIRNSLRKVILWISIALLPTSLIVLYGQVQALGGWDNFQSGESRVTVLVGATASIVSMVPQGLILITSIAFGLAAVKLARRNVLVQELPAVESLARVDIICFDKTGTLTKGELLLGEVISLQQGSPSFLAWQDVLAHFGHDPDANATAMTLRSNFPLANNLKVNTSIPFSSTRKWSGYEFLAQDGGGEIWLLGAPELILNQIDHSAALSKAQELSQLGFRVLALTSSDSRLGLTESLPTGLTPRALITIREEIREDSLQTLNYFKEQGVEIRVISGDNPLTVAGVARAAGITRFGTAADAQAIDARNLPTDLDQLAKIMDNFFIFGRVTPEQKRDMVKAMQSHGRVVAMTGDGINDALALKQSDLGIAMGSGSAATRAVSRMVLLDGKFSSLAGVVAEGRKVIANIELVARLFLTKTTWAMFLAITFGLMLWRFPYLPRQITALDLFIIGIPSFALALLPNKQRYLPGFIRRTLQFAIPSGLIIGSSVVILTVILQLQSNPSSVDLAVSQTSVIMLLSLTGLWVIVILARPLDWWRLSITVFCYLIFVFIFLTPFISEFFGFTSLSWPSLIWPLTLSLFASGGIELIHRSAVSSSKRRLVTHTQ